MKIEKQVSWNQYREKVFEITMFFDETEREEILEAFKKEIYSKDE